MAAGFRAGDAAYIVENNRIVRECTVVRGSGDLYIIRFAGQDNADSRYLTVANLLTGDATIARVPLGQIGKEVLERIYPEYDPELFYMGGGAMNCHPMKPEEKINQSTGLIAIGRMPDYGAAGKCKGCGACSANCPQGIHIHKIVQAMEKEKLNQADTLEANRCISCGACTYGCRAGKDVRALIAEVQTM